MAKGFTPTARRGGDDNQTYLFGDGVRLRACSVYDFLSRIVAGCRCREGGRQREPEVQVFTPEHIRIRRFFKITLGSLHQVTGSHHVSVSSNNAAPACEKTTFMTACTINATRSRMLVQE